MEPDQVQENQRPLSPHLQIYKLQLTSLLSITHRFTGIILTAGVFFIIVWLLLIGLGQSYYSYLHSFLQGFIGKILVFVWVYSFFYHLFNGIRHLFWDAGLGFDLKTVYRSGWAVVIASVFFTAIFYLLTFLKLGF
jgi:succinate dehydrogenase / fumarate reductase cytochrome b subunit